LLLNHFALQNYTKKMIYARKKRKIAPKNDFFKWKMENGKLKVER